MPGAGPSRMTTLRGGLCGRRVAERGGDDAADAPAAEDALDARVEGELEPVGEDVDGEAGLLLPVGVDRLELEHPQRGPRGQVLGEALPAQSGEAAGVDHAKLGHTSIERVTARLIRQRMNSRTSAWYSGTSMRNESWPQGDSTSWCSTRAPMAAQRLRHARRVLGAEAPVRAEGDQLEARGRRARHALVAERVEVVHHPRQVQVGARVEAGEEDRRLVVEVVLDLVVGRRASSAVRDAARARRTSAPSPPPRGR